MLTRLTSLPAPHTHSCADSAVPADPRRGRRQLDRPMVRQRRHPHPVMRVATDPGRPRAARALRDGRDPVPAARLQDAVVVLLPVQCTHEHQGPTDHRPPTTDIHTMEHRAPPTPDPAPRYHLGSVQRHGGAGRNANRQRWHRTGHPWCAHLVARRQRNHDGDTGTLLCEICSVTWTRGDGPTALRRRDRPTTALRRRLPQPAAVHAARAASCAGHSNDAGHPPDR